MTKTFLAANRMGKTSLCLAESLVAMGLPKDQIEEIMDVWYGRSDEDQKYYTDIEDIVGLTVIDIRLSDDCSHLHLDLKNDDGKILCLAYMAKFTTTCCGSLGLKGQEDIIGEKVDDIWDDYSEDADYNLTKYTKIYSQKGICTIYGEFELAESLTND